ncbi:Replication factor RFC1 subunit 1 [Carpediemonas membranifera]|uniref:Replication factor RFC1 subunit 1 n=1 Tax=Carpediemonas membranifera TaxID=201153 RepID=A0A8J6E1H5_9EUKA|nr:Replication factor RFC1 subunit 1 [Carpediemonas membranifera]|eukprot:KAG9393071.1 Replication factor RFC1 subunit 1 [Carpediemonas membranifera]
MDALWTDKYRPQHRSELIANESAISTLYRWLESWVEKYKGETQGAESQGIRDAKKKAKSSEGFKRAVLISGPPGIGKTSTALVAAKELGFSIHEMNASDVRSKGSLEEHVKHLRDNQTISHFFGARQAKTSRPVLIMDEVDGMSQGDRGGVQELISIIVESRIPIICICNDDEKQSIKTLTQYCLPIPFFQPDPDDLVRRISLLVQKEGLTVDPTLLRVLVEENRGDIRQVVHSLQTWSGEGAKSRDDIHNAAKLPNLSMAESVAQAFERGRPITDRREAYFKDTGMTPFYLYDNYLTLLREVRPGPQQFLMGVVSESMSFGEILGDAIGSTQNYSIAPHHAVATVAGPAMAIGNAVRGVRPDQLTFPYEVLGKISKTNKQVRLTGEIASRLSAKGVMCDREACATDVLGSGALYERINAGLSTLATPGAAKDKELVARIVDETIDRMVEAGISREDMDVLADRYFVGPGKGGTKAAKVPGAVSARLTREYNKRMAEYSALSKAKAKKVKAFAVKPEKPVKRPKKK